MIFYLLILLFSLLSYAGLIFVFLKDLSGTAAGYVFYFLSALSLTADVWLSGRSVRRVKAFLYKIPFFSKLFTEFWFREKVWLNTGLAVSLFHVGIHLYAGMRSGAMWQMLLGLFFLILCIAKTGLLKNAAKKDYRADPEGEIRIYKRTAVLILFLCMPLAGILVMMGAEGYSYQYNSFLIYGIAAVVFYNIISSSVNLFRYRKHKSPLLSAVKRLNFINSLLSLQGLETAMISAFGDGRGPFRQQMVGTTGAFVFVLTLASGIQMFLNKKWENIIDQA